MCRMGVDEFIQKGFIIRKESFYKGCVDIVIEYMIEPPGVHQVGENCRLWHCLSNCLGIFVVSILNHHIDAGLASVM